LPIHPDVVFRVLGDAAVLVNLSSNEIFELNATGAVIWTLTGEGRSTDEIVAALVARFDVDATTARRACDDLTAELLARDLLLP
jgi:hypothetical protein